VPPTPPAPGAQGKTHGAFIGISWDNVVVFFQTKTLVLFMLYVSTNGDLSTGDIFSGIS